MSEPTPANKMTNVGTIGGGGGGVSTEVIKELVDRITDLETGNNAHDKDTADRLRAVEDAVALPETELTTEGPVNLTVGKWVTLVPTAQDGSYTVDMAKGGIVVPKTATYSLTVTTHPGLPAATPDHDVLYRVVTTGGVLAAGAQRIAATEAPLLHFNDVFEAAATTQMWVQVYTTAALSLSQVSVRVAALRVATKETVLPGLAEPYNEPFVSGDKQLDIVIGEQNLGRDQWSKVTAESSGVAVVSDPDGKSVRLSTVGRLYSVEGALPKATRFDLDVSSNGFSTVPWPQTLRGKINKTGGKIDKSSQGAEDAPGLIYIQQPTAQLNVATSGPDSAGGRITLVDRTPFDYIGGEITFDGPGWVIKGSGELNCATSTPPIVSWAAGDHKGRVFLLSKLPYGVYKISGEVTVDGPHKDFEVRMGYRSWPNDVPQVLRKRIEGSKTIYTVLFYNFKKHRGNEIEAIYFGLTGTAGDTVDVSGKLEVRRMMYLGYDPVTQQFLGDPHPEFTIGIPSQPVKQSLLAMENLFIKDYKHCTEPAVSAADNLDTFTALHPPKWHGYNDYAVKGMVETTCMQTSDASPWRVQSTLKVTNGGLTRAKLSLVRADGKQHSNTVLSKGDEPDMWHIGALDPRGFYEGLVVGDPGADVNGIGGYTALILYVEGTAGAIIEGEILSRQVNSFPSLDTA